MAIVAFLGAGLIGSGLAEAAIGRGDAVRVHNRTPGKTGRLAELGAVVAPSFSDAVRGAERVHLALNDDASVDAVLDACGDALAGAVVVDHTTTAPAGTAQRSARLDARGHAFLHAPVFMSPAMCRSAQGIMLVAGRRSTFDRVEAALGAMTGSVEYLGERADAAAAFKLFGNAMIVSIVAGLSDVYAMAAELGIPATEAHGLFSKFNPAALIAHRGKNMAAGRYAPSFELTMARKDVRLMLEASGQRRLTVLGAIAARMDELLAAGYGAADVGVLSIDSVPRSD